MPKKEKEKKIKSNLPNLAFDKPESVSIWIMGFANLIHKQFIKGIIFLTIQVAYIWFNRLIAILVLLYFIF